MKFVKTIDAFINESKINVLPELDAEILKLTNDLVSHYSFMKIEDDDYVVIETPFTLHPDATNKDWIKKTGIVFYPELLSYGNPDKKSESVTVPWIACRITVDSTNDDKLVIELLKWIADRLKEINYKPFMDEDAYFNHWKKDLSHKDFKEYTCYVNPSYPEGWWENHTLE